MAAPHVVRANPRPLEPERRLAALARARGPLRRVIAALAGRLVTRRGWERLGYARLADYARERLGLSARSLQDLARVDRQLAALPGLEATLMSGRLPWSKVRLLARFTTAADEEYWIAHAVHRSVRVLEREVRAVDRGSREGGGLSTDEDASDTEPVRAVRIRAPAALCFKWMRTREYAAKVAGERIAPSAALEMVAAEALSALPVPLAGAAADPSSGTSWRDATAAEAGTHPREPASPGGAEVMANVCAAQGRETGAERVELPPFLRPLLRNLDAADPFDLDLRLRRAVRLEQRLDAEIAPLLRYVSASEYPWRTRYQTLAIFARECLGMSPRKARALLRLERVGDRCPELRAAYRDGVLSWVQAQLLAPLLLGAAEGDWRRRWVDWAQGVTVRRLEENIDRALLWRETDPRAWEACREEPERAAGAPGEPLAERPHGERQTCAQPTEPRGHASIRVSGPHDVARLFQAVLCTVRRAIEQETGRLPSEAEGFETMIDHALRTWGVDDLWLRQRLRRSMGKKYAIFERDDWRCTVPGCTSRRNLQAHHVVFRSAGGSDALENQTTLCAHHHHRGVHAGTVRILGTAPGALRFELGTRAGRPPLVRYGSGDRVAATG